MGYFLLKMAFEGKKMEFGSKKMEFWGTKSQIDCVFKQIQNAYFP